MESTIVKNSLGTVTIEGVEVEKVEYVTTYETDDLTLGEDRSIQYEPVEYRGIDPYYADYLSGGYCWTVSQDLRTPGSGMEESNYDYADKAREITKARGLDVKYDPEMCQFFAYTRDLGTAKALVDILLDEVK